MGKLKQKNSNDWMLGTINLVKLSQNMEDFRGPYSVLCGWRTPQEQAKEKIKYIKADARRRYNSQASQLIKHKVAYYKLLDERKRWEAFDELCDLNDDTKEEIRKYL